MSRNQLFKRDEPQAIAAKTKARSRSVLGFTLTEMLATMMIMTLVSTLMATGIPVAIDTYQKTVKSANAQVAISTTLTVLRSELGMSTIVWVPTSATSKGDDPEKAIYYLSEDGYWACIRNSRSSNHGLEKQYYAGMLDFSASDPTAGLTETIDEDAHIYPLVSDSAITDALWVTFDTAALDASNKTVKVSGLCVKDASGNTLASVLISEDGTHEPFPILVRYLTS